MALSRQTERNRRLAEIGAAPQKDYEQSRAEQQALEESLRSQESVIAGLAARLKRFGAAEGSPAVTTIRSPFAGVVTKVQAAPGEVVSGEAELFTVADLPQVWVQAEVYEQDLGRVQVGQAARLKVDMFASVQLPTTFNRRALAVPAGAVQQVEGKDVIFVRKAPTQFEAREGEAVAVQAALHLKSIMASKGLGEE